MEIAGRHPHAGTNIAAITVAASLKEDAIENASSNKNRARLHYWPATYTGTVHTAGTEHWLEWRTTVGEPATWAGHTPSRTNSGGPGGTVDPPESARRLARVGAMARNNGP